MCRLHQCRKSCVGGKACLARSVVRLGYYCADKHEVKQNPHVQHLRKLNSHVPGDALPSLQLLLVVGSTKGRDQVTDHKIRWDEMTGKAILYPERLFQDVFTGCVGLLSCRRKKCLQTGLDACTMLLCARTFTLLVRSAVKVLINAGMPVLLTNVSEP